MRFAFLTPEFASDYSDGGGLGQATAKITKALVERGHEVEVFVNSDIQPKIISHQGVRVQRVPTREARVFKRKSFRLMQRFLPSGLFRVDLEMLLRADALSQAMERRHCLNGFDVIHSADYFGVGYYVADRPNRIHIIRVSCPIDLYHQADQRKDPAAASQRHLEFAAIQRADGCYAPSAFVAKHYSELLGITVQTIRTPRQNGGVSFEELPIELPARYLLFYGQLIRRKGFEVLAEAMRRAFAKQSDLMWVIVGYGDPGYVSQVLSVLKEYRSRVLLLYPLPHDQMMTVVKGAVAAVLPSIVDNLPNTAIECLSQGTPVIGPRGASFDELVEDGVTGRLINVGDPEELACAIVEAWRGSGEYTKGFEWNSPVGKELNIDSSTAALVDFCSDRLQNKMLTV
jgi:glycosyltransferase involved in cell wall biosynthesis